MVFHNILRNTYVGFSTQNLKKHMNDYMTLEQNYCDAFPSVDN